MFGVTIIRKGKNAKHYTIPATVPSNDYPTFNIQYSTCNILVTCPFRESHELKFVYIIGA